MLTAEGMESPGHAQPAWHQVVGNAALKSNRTLLQIERFLVEAAEKATAEGVRQGGGRQSATARTLARQAEGLERLARAPGRRCQRPGSPRGAARQQDAWERRVRRERRGRHPGDDSPRANRPGTEQRANTTEPDVWVMQNQKGYVAGYNGKLVVIGEQAIAEAMVSQHPGDRTLLHQLLDNRGHPVGLRALPGSVHDKKGRVDLRRPGERRTTLAA